MDAARFRAVNSPRAYWGFVGELANRVLTDLGRGRRTCHIAPPVLPFRPSPVGHMHDQIELLFGAVGVGGMRLREGAVPIRPGAVTVIPRGVPHREYIDDRQQPYGNIVCNVGPEAFSGHTRFDDPGGDHRRFPARLADPRAGRTYRYLVEATAAVGQGASEGDHLVRGLVQAALAVMLDAMSGLEPTTAEDHLVHVAQMYVETHLCLPELSVAQIAAELGYSADYLSHRFHAVKSIRLTAFIAEQRMLLANRLLEEGAFNISEVARACGFRDPAYFSRVFRAHHGQSPRAWRNSR